MIPQGRISASAPTPTRLSRDNIVRAALSVRPLFDKVTDKTRDTVPLKRSLLP